MSIGLWQRSSSCHVQTTMEASFLRFLQSFDFESNFSLDTTFKRAKSILMLKSWNVGFDKWTWNKLLFCKYKQEKEFGSSFVARKQQLLFWKSKSFLCACKKFRRLTLTFWFWELSVRCSKRNITTKTNVPKENNGRHSFWKQLRNITIFQLS